MEWDIATSDGTTAAAPANEVEAVVRSPTNMAAADIAAVDFNKMTSLIYCSFIQSALGHYQDRVEN